MVSMGVWNLSFWLSVKMRIQIMDWYFIFQSFMAFLFTVYDVAYSHYRSFIFTEKYCLKKKNHFIRRTAWFRACNAESLS